MQFESSSETGKSIRGIKVGDWTITVTKAPILNSSELDPVSKILAFPLPEMLFGNSCLSVQNSNGIGFFYSFDAIGALKMVDCSPTSSDFVKVSMAEKWTEKSSKYHQDIKDVIKPYDWVR